MTQTEFEAFDAFDREVVQNLPILHAHVGADVCACASKASQRQWVLLFGAQAARHETWGHACCEHEVFFPGEFRPYEGNLLQVYLVGREEEDACHLVWGPDRPQARGCSDQAVFRFTRSFRSVESDG